MKKQLKWEQILFQKDNQIKCTGTSKSICFSLFFQQLTIGIDQYLSFQSKFLVNIPKARS